ncbi:MAG: hypothetical protein ACRC5C_01035 [Bacilli bacterium]
MMEFLYFPENKAEYIPAVLAFIPFLLGAIFTFVFFRRYSKKEQARFAKLEEQILAQHNTRE